MRQGLNSQLAQRWQTVPPARKRLVMWGAADQGRVNAEILGALGCEIAAFIDDTPDILSPLPAVPLVRGWQGFESWLQQQSVAEIGFVIAIGNPYGHVRVELHDRLIRKGLAPISFADPSSLLCVTASLGDGLQAMPMALVHREARIGRQCIINTKALVEHDCVLEDGVEIGPGAILCGRVHVGANSWIGAGAVIRPRIRIGRNALIGVGAVVVSDIPDGVVAVGIPARPVPGKITASARANR